jgi:hypothetical protein
MRIVITGIVGGLLVFFWGFLAHAVLPLGAAGMTYLGDPFEDAVIAAVREHVKEPGLYLFPFINMAAADQAAEQKRAGDKSRAGPRGILLANPKGGEMMTPDMLAIEFATNVVTALLVAFALSMATGLTNFVSRVGFAALLGLVAGIAVNVPHRNWYGFPASFTLAAILEHVVGFALVGLAAAFIMIPAATATSMQTGPGG